jgi:superkiller protein 3
MALSGDFARGNQLVSAGRREEAAAAYREAIRADGRNYEAWHNLGCVLGELGRMDEAAAAFEETLRLKPDHPTARKNLELIPGRRGRSR